MIDRETLSKLASWSGFCGVMFIILGVLGAIGGLFAFIIGAIPGIIMIMMGVKLLNAKNKVNLMLMQPAGVDTAASLNAVFSDLKSFFQFQGILFIIYLVLIGISILIGVVVGIGALTSLNSLL